MPGQIPDFERPLTHTRPSSHRPLTEVPDYRSRGPSPYRQWSRSPTRYRTQAHYPDRSPSPGWYEEHYGGRSHPPSYYHQRDREERGRYAGPASYGSPRAGSPDISEVPRPSHPPSHRPSRPVSYVPVEEGRRSPSRSLSISEHDEQERAGGHPTSRPGTAHPSEYPRSPTYDQQSPRHVEEEAEIQERLPPLSRGPSVISPRAPSRAPSVTHAALPTVVQVGHPESIRTRSPLPEGDEYEEGVPIGELEDQLRHAPYDGFIPRTGTGPTVPGTVYEEEGAPGAPAPSEWQGARPGDLSFDEAAQARLQRFDEYEGHMQDVTRAAEEAENAREDAFRHNEEERDRIFEENEARRENEAAQRRDAIWQDLESRLGALPPASPVAPILPSEEALPVPPPGEVVEEVVEEDMGTATPEHASIIESIRSSTRDAAAARDERISQIIKDEREEVGRQFEIMMADRTRHDEELAAERARVEEERNRRIAELEEELSRVRGELEAEKQLRVTEEAERREIERAETIERDEAVRAQLGDITNLVQEQRDECQRKKELNEERWNEKLTRREEKKAEADAMREMLAEILAETRAAKQSCEEDRQHAAQRSGTSHAICAAFYQHAHCRVQTTSSNSLKSSVVKMPDCARCLRHSQIVCFPSTCAR